MPAQSWLNRIWYVQHAPPPWLLPAEKLFAAAAGLRRWLYARQLRRVVRVPRPVVVIGNLTVGGTGKTPVVCWLVERLTALGYRPGVVTRGYGGSNSLPRLVRAADTAAQVGDEPVLLMRRTHVPVAVGRDRPAAAQILVDAGCDVIISDDGLQHYALARDCEIVIVDAERGYGNGHLLPAGPLREPLGRLAAVDAIVVNGASSGTAHFDATAGMSSVAPAGGVPRAFGMQLLDSQARSLLGSNTRDLREFTASAVHAVAGIGNPQRFFRMLRLAGLEVNAHALPDHAVIKPADIDFGDGLPVLMTEKDAVKCAGFASAQHWYVPVSVSFESDGATQILDIVTRRIKASKGNHG